MLRIILELPFLEPRRNVVEIQSIAKLEYHGGTDRSITAKKLENSHKNSTISYWNLQECGGSGRKRIKKNTRNGRRAESMKPKRAARH
jgi:hypothetical protein